MRKLLFIGVLLFLNQTFAAVNEIVTDANQKTSSDTYAAKTVAGAYEYKEPGVMSISGALAGIEITGLHALPDDFFVGGGVEYFAGSPEYEGSFQDGTPTKHRSTDYFYTINALGGRKLYLENSSTFFELSSGLAYRYLNDKGHGIGSYEREQTYLYIPLNIAYDTYLGQLWRLHASAEFDLFIAGRNTSHLEDIDSSLEPETFKQNSGSGNKLTIGLSKEYSRHTIIGDLFYRRWSIADSDKNYFLAKNKDTGDLERWYSVEPNNTTTMLGVSFGVQF